MKVDDRWRTVDGSLQMADGRRQTVDGTRQTVHGTRYTLHGGRFTADDGWLGVESRGWTENNDLYNVLLSKHEIIICKKYYLLLSQHLHIFRSLTLLLQHWNPCKILNDLL